MSDVKGLVQEKMSAVVAPIWAKCVEKVKAIETQYREMDVVADSKIDRFFDQYEERMFEGKTKSVFAPLCGKALDLIWLHEKGHTVVGVEIAEQAVRELFQENNIDFDVVEVDKVGNLYKSKEGRLQVYAADLFDVTPERCGQFDIIWDSKSIVAINLEDHIRYRDLLLSLMKPDGTYYMWTIEYENPSFAGPPHTFTEKMVQDLFEAACNIEVAVEMDQTNQTTFSPEQLDKMNAERRAIMTSSSVIFRWHIMKFK